MPLDTFFANSCTTSAWFSRPGDVSLCIQMGFVLSLDIWLLDILPLDISFLDKFSLDKFSLDNWCPDNLWLDKLSSDNWSLDSSSVSLTSYKCAILSETISNLFLLLLLRCPMLRCPCLFSLFGLSTKMYNSLLFFFSKICFLEMACFICLYFLNKIWNMTI